MTIDSKQRAQILQALKKLVLAHHINVAGIDYGAWTERVNSRTAELLNTDVAGFEVGVRELLTDLKTSHTVFYHSLPTELLPQHTINASLRDVLQHGQHKWMFLDVFEDGPAHLAGIRPGELLDAVDGTPCLYPPLRLTLAWGKLTSCLSRKSARRAQRNSWLRYPSEKEHASAPHSSNRRARSTRKSGKTYRYIQDHLLSRRHGNEIRDRTNRAVNDLKRQNCDRLIIDLRGNIGGSLGFTRLASYMCPGQIAIGHSLTRSVYETAMIARPYPRADAPKPAELLVTLARYAIRENKSLMLLTPGPWCTAISNGLSCWSTNGQTAQPRWREFAAENDLATLVGQKTRGNVLGATNFKLPGGYWLRLPIFGWFTSKGNSLEANGVDPDVEIPPPAETVWLLAEMTK